MKVITVAMRKGGNGKSTSTLNLSKALELKGCKVLVIDLDEQGNTSSTMGIDSKHKWIEEILIRDVELKEEDLLKWEGVSLLGTRGGLSGVTRELDREVGSHNVLKEKLQSIKDKYDYCLIDTSPSLNILTLNALCASDYVFIPLSSKYYSLKGVVQTLEAIEKVQMRLNYNLMLIGMAFVIHDARSGLSKEVLSKLQEEHGEVLFKAVVNQNIKIEEAQVKGLSIFNYSSSDKGSIQYMELAEEFLLKIKEEEKDTSFILEKEV